MLSSKRITLFRLFGFEIKIEWSWLILAVWLTWSLADSVFPGRYHGLPRSTYWWMGLVGALGLFASIVFHELWHALVARRYGIPIRGITLFIFGGVAELDDDPPSAKTEFLLALAGPASSAFLALVFHLLRTLSTFTNWPPAIVAVKSIHPPNSVAATGLPITFTHAITNDGAAIMTVLPLTDTYDPTFLTFNYAVPTPTVAITGTLVWTDLTTYFGDLQPFQTVIVTTVFTATTQVVSTSVNQASTEGAIDIYDNDLTAGSAQVPITIIDGGPTATRTPTPVATATTVPTPVPTATPRPTNTPAPGPTATSAPAIPAPTATTEATSTPVAALLPQAGRESVAGLFVLLCALLALGAGFGILIHVRR